MTMMPFDNNEIEDLLSEAEAFLQEQKPGEALEILERARAIEARHPWVMLFRGVALGQLGRGDEAVEQLLSAADTSLDDIDIQVDAARHLSLLEYAQDALVCASRAVELDETDAGAQSVRAEALERLGRLEEAISVRETAVLLDETDLDSRFNLALDLCDVGRYEEALTLAEKLQPELPEDPEVVRLHGACLNYVGRYEDALARWAELERMEGNTPNLLHNRANTLQALGRYDEALETINQAIDGEPDTAINYYTRALVREHRDEEDSALDDYLAALARDSELLDAAINLIDLAVTVGAAEIALDQIELFLETEPTSATLQYTRGRLLMELGRLLEGRQAIEDAVRREPNLGIGWYTLSMLYGMAGEAEQALVASDRALRSFPDDPGLWINRGQALHELKRFPEAMSCYDRAIQLDGEDWLPWFHLGRLLLLDLERLNDARGVLREALRLQPNNDVIQWMLALCYLRLGQHQEADSELVSVLEREPNHLWGRLVRAALHAQRGEIDDAFADLKIVTGQGYDARLLRSEPLFKPLWSDPRFLAAAREPRGKRKR